MAIGGVIIPGGNGYLPLTGGTISGTLLVTDGIVGSVTGDLYGKASSAASADYATAAASATTADKAATADTAANAGKWNGWTFVQNHATITDSTQIPIINRAGTMNYALVKELAAQSSVSASGDGYIRFTDGTQICWGEITFGPLSAGSVTYASLYFAVPFANTRYRVSTVQSYDVGDTYLLNVNQVYKRTTSVDVYVNNGKDFTNLGGVKHDVIAIGRWK